MYMIFGKDSMWKYLWKWQDWSRMYFTWSPKFIVQSLVKIFGVEKWEQVFDDFMKWVEGIKDLDYPAYWKDSPATFVLYKKKKDENKGYGQRNTKKVYDTEEESGEDGEDFRS